MSCPFNTLDCILCIYLNVDFKIQFFFYFFIESIGAMFDKEGNLANWWSKSSLSNFREREECFVRQYSADSVLGHNVSKGCPSTN